MRFTHKSGFRHQQGLGVTAVFLILSVSVFLGLFALKVGPHYFENWTVSKIAEDVSTNQELLSQPKSKVYNYINQAYRTNNLWDLKAEDTIKLERDGQRGFIVSVQYEKRANLIHNIDLITRFDTTL